MDQLVYPMRRKKKFFIPLNIVGNRCNKLVDGIILNKNYEIVFDNDGKLYLMSDYKTIEDGYEMIFNENKRLMQKRCNSMFKVKKPFNKKCFSKGLKTGMFFSLKAKSYFGLRKSYLHCEIFSSLSSLYQNLDNGIEKNFKLLSKVQHLIAVQISSKNKFFAVVYKCTNNERVKCEFLSLVENEEKDNSWDNQQLELTKIFPYSTSLMNICFNEVDTLCLFYTAYAAGVYSIKERLLFTIPQTLSDTFVKSSFLVNDSQKGDLCFYYEQNLNHVNQITDDLIHCYAVKSMCLESILKFKLSEFGIILAHSICVSSFTKNLLFVSDRNSIYVMDLCQFSEQPVLLRTINLSFDFMQSNLYVNWTGEELIYYGQRRYEEYHLKVYYFNHDYSGNNFSLFNLARNIVLTIYTSEQLRKLNLPKMFRYYLGL